MFFGSLSGAGDDDDAAPQMSGRHGGASMAGAEDDIAEFLGETKKKKNRPGQMARRQKAMRQEEARQRQEQRANGSYNPRFDRQANSLSKYGPSERPKKPKAAAPGGAKSSGASSSSRGQKRPSAGHDGAFRSEKRRAVDSRDDSRASRYAPSSHSQPKPKPAAPAPVRPAGNANRKPEPAPSHPSWLAKQALKEKQKVSIQSFAGKKITFGDD
ncbi:hypothetical protein PINS_up006930 [Pythium insidiosum]|nr:hypothetical protein PINS_up006930 [Pythium insidiosum]